MGEGKLPLVATHSSELPSAPTGEDEPRVYFGSIFKLETVCECEGEGETWRQR